MTQQEHKQIGKELGISWHTVASRDYVGWTRKEIIEGRRGIRWTDVAKKYGLHPNTIYNRRRRGWTKQELLANHREEKPKKKYVGVETFLLVCLFDIVKSITKFHDEMDSYKLTCLVYRGLQDRLVE